jgi:hypothetical protein
LGPPWVSVCVVAVAVACTPHQVSLPFKFPNFPSGLLFWRRVISESHWAWSFAACSFACTQHALGPCHPGAPAARTCFTCATHWVHSWPLLGTWGRARRFVGGPRLRPSAVGPMIGPQAPRVTCPVLTAFVEPSQTVLPHLPTPTAPLPSHMFVATLCRCGCACMCMGVCVGLWAKVECQQTVLVMALPVAELST